MRHGLALLGLLIASAVPAAAQTVYATGPDTLRFRDVTRAEIRLTTQQGELPLHSEHGATVAGYFVFAPQAGRMLARRREGRLSGDIVMRGEAGDMSMKQSYTYRNALDAIR